MSLIFKTHWLTGIDNNGSWESLLPILTVFLRRLSFRTLCVFIRIWRVGPRKTFHPSLSFWSQETFNRWWMKRIFSSDRMCKRAYFFRIWKRILNFAVDGFQAPGNGNEIVLMGLKCMFSVLHELNRRDSELCAEALTSLLHLIERVPPYALANETYASIESMYSMLYQLRMEGSFQRWI